MKMLRLMPSILAYTVCFFAGAHAHAGLIASYSAVAGGNPDAVSRVTVGTDSVDFNIIPSVSDPVGSRRRLEVTEFSASQSASLTINRGVASINSSAGSTANWNIIYGVGGLGLHYDATDGGTANAFRLTFNNFSPGLQYAIGAFGYSFKGPSNNGVFQPLSSSVVVPFASFSNGNLIDFSDLNQISLRFRDGGLSNGGAAALTRFETIPEPASGTLLGGATLLAGLGARYRQRRCRR